MIITPTSNRLLVKIIVPKDTMCDGILVPASMSDRDVQHATVISVGPKVTDIPVGATVLLGSYRATEIKVDGESFALLVDDEVLGILE